MPRSIFAVLMLVSGVGCATVRTADGGTSFVPALSRLIDEARRKLERFSVVYLTDLEGMLPRSRDARCLDVLWVVPRRPRRKPPFGTVVEIISPASGGADRSR